MSTPEDPIPSPPGGESGESPEDLPEAESVLPAEETSEPAEGAPEATGAPSGPAALAGATGARPVRYDGAPEAGASADGELSERPRRGERPGALTAGRLAEERPRIYEETKRVARLLDIIARVSSRPRVWTRRALAQAFEVSERRIQEDLEILVNRLKLPLAHSRTGYYLREVWPLPAVSFAFSEAAALLLAASVGRATSGVDSAELAAGLTRLREVFPPELRRLLVTLEVPEEPQPGEVHRREVLERLQGAIATRTAVQMRYATASREGAESERLVEPYTLVPYVRSFFLVGYCHNREEVRIFKVDRIRELRLTERRFEVPEGFDVERYLGESWGLLRGVAREPEQVQIRFSARAGRWVSEERWHPGQQAEWQADGTLLFTLRVGVTPAFVRWVLYYGSDAEVLRPAWLAAAVRREAQAVVERYEGQGPSG